MIGAKYTQSGYMWRVPRVPGFTSAFPTEGLLLITLMHQLANRFANGRFLEFLNAFFHEFPPFVLTTVPRKAAEKIRFSVVLTVGDHAEKPKHRPVWKNYYCSFQVLGTVKYFLSSISRVLGVI